jgi:hypothetical protein
MKILFAISILSFLVLLWAAIAITRRIRASHRAERSGASTQPEFSQYLFAATESNDAAAHSAAHSGLTGPYDKATSTERG